MRRADVRIILVLAILAATAAADAGVLVTLRPKATAAGGLLTLAEVADVRATDPADGQRLSTILLGPAPAAGRESRVTYETVRSRLLAAGVDLATVQFAGATTVVVSGPAAPEEEVAPPVRHEVTPTARGRVEEAVTAAVRRYLTSRTGGSFAVEAKVSVADAATLAVAATRGCEVSGGVPPWTGEQHFIVKVLDEAELVREVRLTCVVSARPSILAAKHSLPRGHVLRPDDLVWRKAETDAEAACATDPRQLLGKETQQVLRTGEAIPLDAVKALPLVRNGQFVTVTSRRPGLAVQRVMKARADGIAGEVIPLQTLEDRKTILARVTGLQEAEVIDDQIRPAAGPAIERQAASIARPMIPPPVATEAAPAEAVGGPILPVLHQQPAEPPRQAPAYRPRVFVNPTQAISVPSGSG